MKMEKMIQELSQLITEKNIELNIAKRKLLSSKLKLKKLQRRLLEFEKAKALILELAKQSKQDIKIYLENIVTNALQIVYGKEYSFVIEIEPKKDQEEIHFYLKVDDNLLEPRKDTVAGGMLDIMSIGLKIGVVSLINSEPVLFFDEPLKNLGAYSFIGANILKEFSKEFSLQVLLITHDNALMEVADKVYQIGD